MSSRRGRHGPADRRVHAGAPGRVRLCRHLGGGHAADILAPHAQVPRGLRSTPLLDARERHGLPTPRVQIAVLRVGGAIPDTAPCHRGIRAVDPVQTDLSTPSRGVACHVLVHGRPATVQAVQAARYRSASHRHTGASISTPVSPTPYRFRQAHPCKPRVVENRPEWR